MSLIDDLVKLEEEAKELVTSADDAAKLEAARVELLGRKGRITGLMRMMGKLAPEDRPVMGNISPSAQFLGGTPDSMTIAVRELLGKCAGYKNFVLSSGCDIPPASSWDNIRAFFAASADFYDNH